MQQTATSTNRKYPHLLRRDDESVSQTDDGTDGTQTQGALALTQSIEHEQTVAANEQNATTQPPNEAYNPDAASPPTTSPIPSNPLTAPYLQQLELNNKKREILRTMPVTNKDGATMTAYQAFANPNDTHEKQAADTEKAFKRFTDQDGRLKSGWQVFLNAIAHNPLIAGARDWSDLAAGLANAGGQFIGGAIRPAANEEQNRQKELGKIDQEDARIKDELNFKLKAVQQESIIADRAKDNQRQQDALDFRKTQSQLNVVKADKQVLLRTVMNQRYYYKGDNDELDRQLAEKGIYIPNFDNTKSGYIDHATGEKKVWDVATKQFVTASGSTPDPTLTPVAVTIDGVDILLKPRDFAQYAVAANTAEYKAKREDEIELEKIKQRNAEGKKKFENDLRTAAEQRSKLITDAKALEDKGLALNDEGVNIVEAAETVAKGYETQAANLTKEKAEPYLRAAREKRAEAKVQSAAKTEESRSKFADAKALRDTKIADPAPFVPEKEEVVRTAPTNPVGLTIRLTADEIRANGKKNKKSEAEIEAKIQEWRDNKLLIEN